MVGNNPIRGRAKVGKTNIIRVKSCYKRIRLWKKNPIRTKKNPISKKNNNPIRQTKNPIRKKNSLMTR